MCLFLSFSVVEIGFILSQRYCRFLFISVVAGLLILLQRQVTTDNDLMETRLKSQQVWYKNSLVATCYLQTCYNLLEQLVASMWKTSFDNQLATSLLNTFNRLFINKLLQDMGTHPDIGCCDKLLQDLLQLARFWLCRFLSMIALILMLSNILHYIYTCLSLHDLFQLNCHISYTCPPIANSKVKLNLYFRA